MVDVITGINIAAFSAVKTLANPLLNSAMQVLAISYIVVLPLIVIYLLYRKDKNNPSFVFSIFALYIFGELLKVLVQEPRPCTISDLSWINSMNCDGGYAFPSNHAITLSGLYIFVNNYKYLRILYIVWLALVLFGRIYLGEHYLSDVIAGAIISLAIAYVIFLKREKINNAFSCIVRSRHK